MELASPVFVFWETEWLTLGVALGTLFVLTLTAFLVLQQLKHAREERETAFVSMTSTRWNEAAMEEARQLVNTYRDSSELLEAINKFEEYNSRFYYVVSRIPDFFEDLGQVCSRDDKLIPLVKDLIGPSVKYYYGLFLPWIKQCEKDPTEGTYPFFKKLAERM